MKELIDFSSKHDMLIINPDGTKSPVDYPFFQIRYIGNKVWQMLTDGDYIYLIEGDDYALVIDSGYGCGDIGSILSTLTDKEIIGVANTHDHFDHIACNCYFKKAFMSPICHSNIGNKFNSADFEGVDFPIDYPVEEITEGYVFHLGNRDIEVFELPDHSESSLVYLDRKGRFLFGGDEIVSRFKIVVGTVERFRNEMEKMVKYRKDFDYVCGGNMICDACYIERYLDCANYILDGGTPEKLDAMPEPDEYTPEGASTDNYIFDRHYPRRMKGRVARKHDCSTMRYMIYADCKIIYDSMRVWDNPDMHK